MREEWRPVVGYEGLYEVSNMGNVKSLKYGKERILKAGKNSADYLQVHLCKDGKAKMYTVHKLVATAFCENPEGYTVVNHIDEDKTNNNADNLEWCSRSYNNTYNDRAKKIGKKLRGRKHSEEHNKKVAEKLTNHPKTSKPIIGIDKVTGLILEFASVHEAERETGIDPSSIIKCCKGKRNSCGGFYWMYKNDNDDAE